MPRKWRGSSQKRIPPDGNVRKGQLITTFGPGALMDLVDHAVLVGGLEFWSYDKAKGFPVIHEPRLRDAIAMRLEGTERKLSVERAFLAPPPCNDQEPTQYAGVQVLEFPQWMVCQNQDCRALVRSTGLETKGGRYWHQCTGGKAWMAVPVRFVGACRRGHVIDFPWIYFTHLEFSKCAAPNLRLREGATGDFSEVRVECSCGAWALMSKAMTVEANPTCPGDRPWLGAQGREEAVPPPPVVVDGDPGEHDQPAEGDRAPAPGGRADEDQDEVDRRECDAEPDHRCRGPVGPLCALRSVNHRTYSQLGCVDRSAVAQTSEVPAERAGVVVPAMQEVGEVLDGPSGGDGSHGRGVTSVSEDHPEVLLVGVFGECERE